MIQDMYFT